jgi:hypothetical protein
MTLSWLNIREARAFGLSDDQEKDELRAQNRLAAAVAEMRAAIEDVNSSSVLVEIEPMSFENFVSDELPSAHYWRARLREAQH